MSRSVRKYPIEILLLPFSLLLAPVLLVGVAVSIPFSALRGRMQQRSEARFAAQMVAIGRLINWSDFMAAANATCGTLILEVFSFKGPMRWWWTEEDVVTTCPYILPGLLELGTDAEFEQTRTWIAERLTGPRSGEALLIYPVPKEQFARFLEAQTVGSSKVVRIMSNRSSGE